MNTAGVGPGLKPGTALSTMGEFFLGEKERTPPGPLPFESPLATWLGHSNPGAPDILDLL